MIGELGRGTSISPMFRAAILNGGEAAVRHQLRRGVDLNATDDKGRTPLILAASRGHLAICRLLLEAGADPSRRDGRGDDALDVAIRHSFLELVEMLGRQTVVETAPATPPTVQIEVEPSLALSSGVAETSPVIATPKDASIVFRPGPEAAADREQVATGAHEPEPDEVVKYASGHVDDPGWEPDVDPPRPPSDATCVTDPEDIQSRLGRHTPIDSDADWDDVEIGLPALIASITRATRLDENRRVVLRSLIAGALREGRVDSGSVIEVCRTQDEASARADLDFEANLRVVLGDLGVIIDDDPDAPSLPPGDPDIEVDDDAVRDALEFFDGLNAGASEPLALYLGGLPSDRLDRESERLLGLLAEAGWKEILAAVARSPAAVSAVLDAIDAVLSGTVRPRVLIEARVITTHTASGEIVRSRQSSEAMDSCPEIRAQLSAAGDLCRRAMRQASRPGDTGIVQRLGTALFELGLSSTFLSVLQVLVADDPEGREARRLMRAGRDKIGTAQTRFFHAN